MLRHREESVWTVRRLNKCAGAWGRAGIVGWEEQKFGSEACTFCRFSETKHSDAETGLWSQNVT